MLKFSKGHKSKKKWIRGTFLRNHFEIRPLEMLFDFFFFFLFSALVAILFSLAELF